MRRRESVPIQFFRAAVRAASSFSDWARRAALTAMLRRSDVPRNASVRSAWNSISCCGLTEQMFPGRKPNSPVERVKIMLKGTLSFSFGIGTLSGLVLAAAIGLASAGASAQSGFTTINATGAGTGPEQGTAVSAIDAAGDIAGIYVDTNNALHCFVQPAGGSIANCDVSGAGSSVGEGTFPTSINSSGVVAGTYIDASGISHGFVRAVNGTITPFNAPGASQAKNRGTTVVSINDSGVIIGTYTTGTYSTISAYYGFMRSADGLTYTAINDPSAGATEDANGKKQGTTPVAINASGAIAAITSIPTACNMALCAPPVARIPRLTLRVWARASIKTTARTSAAPPLRASTRRGMWWELTSTQAVHSMASSAARMEPSTRSMCLGQAQTRVQQAGAAAKKSVARFSFCRTQRGT